MRNEERTKIRRYGVSGRRGPPGGEPDQAGVGEVTELLLEARSGDRRCLDRLLPLVYDELRRLAGGQLRRERRGHTLPATALAHEAYLKLVDHGRIEWRERAHFFAVARSRHAPGPGGARP